MAIKKMELVDPKLRSTTDLRNYKTDITKAVLAIIPAAKVDVFQDYYVTDTPTPITKGEARQIGKTIASTCTSLAGLVREYYYGSNKNQRSGQLFIERK